MEAKGQRVPVIYRYPRTCWCGYIPVTRVSYPSPGGMFFLEEGWACSKPRCLSLSTSDFGGPTSYTEGGPGCCRAASVVPTHSMPGTPPVVMTTDVLRHCPVSPRGRVIPQETPWSEATTLLSMAFPPPPHPLLGAGGLTPTSYHAAVHVRKQSLGLSHP